MARLGRELPVGFLLVAAAEQDAGDRADGRGAALDSEHSGRDEELPRAHDEVGRPALLVLRDQEVAGKLGQFREPLIGVRDPGDPFERIVAVRRMLEVERGNAEHLVTLRQPVPSGGLEDFPFHVHDDA